MTRPGFRRPGLCKPWRAACPVDLKPQPSTSLMKVRKFTGFRLPGTMPNSAACLIELNASPPALAGPITLRLAPATTQRENLAVQRSYDLGHVRLEPRGAT